jgi:hypothetical protein
VVCWLSQSFLGFSRSTAIYPIYDSQEFQLPRNLRLAFHVRVGQPILNITGLNRLNISGSGQFSEGTFLNMLHSFAFSPKKLIVIDLRQESHGFINGKPVSWTDGNNYANICKTKEEVESDEYQRLQLASQAQQIVIDPLEKPDKLAVCTIKIEKELVESIGAIYIRLPVSDHKRPCDDVVDQVVELVKNITPDYWIHVHCKGGRGRTTTFLTLFDITKNAHQVSLNDILVRQYLIGGIDLTQIEKQDEERSQGSKERLTFIQQFYCYCQQVPNFEISWSQWLDKQHLIFANNS